MFRKHLIYTSKNFLLKKKVFTSSKSVEYPVLAQHRVTVSADEDSRLGVPEDIVLFQQPCNIQVQHHDAEVHWNCVGGKGVRDYMRHEQDHHLVLR